ncbi:MAG: peptidase M15 [Bdellovibrionales bacterium]|nr:peptidase M15 [Bdellovibrionales bacterium]
MLTEFCQQLFDYPESERFARLETLCTSALLFQLRQEVRIEDSGEDLFDVRDLPVRWFDPHPYQSVGAPYAEHSPFSVRSSVHQRLARAAELLLRRESDYRLCIFDAYRPVPVQAFMIEHELAQLVRARGLKGDEVSAVELSELRREVLTIWAPASDDPKVPPPHSTGAAIDLTIVDRDGEPIAMGGEIDQIGEAARPSYYAEARGEAARFHQNRMLLAEVMGQVGFFQLPFEWWHFSFGDQTWAMGEKIFGRCREPVARYGRVGCAG